MDSADQEKLYVNAAGLSSGGGKIVLLGWLDSFDEKAEVLLDIRLRDSVPKKENLIYRYYKSHLTRFLKDIFLSNRKRFQKRLYLGNIGPLLGIRRASTTLLIQNRLLIESYDLKSYPLKVKIRVFVERLLLRYSLRNVEYVWVQTESMRKIVSYAYPGVKIFVRETPPNIGNPEKIKDFQDAYFYPASGEPHKNHKNLILAWIILAREKNLRPRLVLTLDNVKYRRLAKSIARLASKYQLNLENKSEINHDTVLSYLAGCGALIFPSFVESYGLPLVEAKMLGVRIISSDADWVYDVARPSLTFDPNEPSSIASAVSADLNAQYSKAV